jgi:LacI family transcriptional regulator
MDELGGLPTTLADVADLAGVSRQTVSNAINNPALLRPDTLARVRDAIERLGYRPNRAARNLRTGASRLIGLRFPRTPEYTADTTMDRFVHALVEASQEAGYHVLLVADGRPRDARDVPAPDPIRGYDDLLRSTSVDAFVITDTYLGNPQARWLTERGAPFVAFGRPWDDPGASHAWVDVDGAAGVRQATEHLLDRGHQRVAWLGWMPGSRIGADRRAGWEQAMTARGLAIDLDRATDGSVHAGRVAAAELLDGPHPTAFVCASDSLAVGVTQALAERGLRTGADASVVGFDDSAVAQLTGLSSVRQPLEDVAVAVVTALQQRLGGEGAEPSGVLLQPTLQVRASSS